MMIIKNRKFNEVKITIMDVLVQISPHDEVLVDDVVGEKLRELQPQLEYHEVPRSDEKEVEERFKKKKVDDAKAVKKEEARVKKQIEDMNKYRAERAKAKADKAKAKPKASKEAPKKKKVVGKQKTSSKKVTKKK